MPHPLIVKCQIKGWLTCFKTPSASRSRHHDRSRPAPPSPFASQRGMEGQAAPHVHSNSMRIPRGNVSHTARGGVDNQVDDSARRARSVGVTSATPPVAEWTTTTTTTTTAPRRTTAAGPATTLCFATGGSGACGSRSRIQPAHRWRDFDTPSRFQPALAFDRAPASRRRTRLAKSNVRGAASAPGPPQPRPVTLAASARSTSNAPPLRDHERQ